MDRLPIEDALPALRRALADAGTAVVTAPPGSGKTTRVPPALLDEPWLGGRTILMLEPRRLAARAAARYMAGRMGQAVGGTVGYRMRQDSRVGPDTRIEVVTEGVLTRRLQRDPGLDGVGLVIFDEFHERSLPADLGLALCLEVRQALRDDLRLLVMSATLDADAVAALLGGAPVVTAQGRTFPVDTHYLGRPGPDGLEAAMAQAVRRVLAETEGGVLAFLPGEREIRRTAERLEGRLPATVDLRPLYGALPPAEQDAAIRPAEAGRRKVVLATAIAETSLTIEGLGVVIDGGRLRGPRFDPRRGMTRLETTAVTRDAAEQRRGRAGRTAPGVCYRLWDEAEQAALLPARRPEILDADLAPLALDLAQWGAAPGDLAWLDPPPAAPWAQAMDLLARLGAVDAGGHITNLGRRMADLPLHPRLSHMVLAAADRDPALGSLACAVAALLADGPPGRETDLRTRLSRLPARAKEAAATWRRRLSLPKAGADGENAGPVLALAYPDRLAQATGDGRFRLANGTGARLDPADALAAEPWLAVAEVGGGIGGDARISLAAPVDRAEIEALAPPEGADVIAWDKRTQAVVARRRVRVGALVLADRPLDAPDPAALAAAMADGVRDLGLDALPWTKAARAWRQRVAFLRHRDGPDGPWPDLSDGALLEDLETWLVPFLTGRTRREHLKDLDLLAILKARLPWDRAAALDRRAPTHVTVPSGAHLPIDYGDPAAPVLAARLQQMFSAAETPTVDDGRVPLTLHLLSPAGRPLQVTQDLAGFWAGSYRDVRADMRGRYPKHPWPEDPAMAKPTDGAKRRG